MTTAQPTITQVVATLDRYSHRQAIRGYTVEPPAEIRYFPPHPRFEHFMPYSTDAQSEEPSYRQVQIPGGRGWYRFPLTIHGIPNPHHANAPSTITESYYYHWTTDPARGNIRRSSTASRFSLALPSMLVAPSPLPSTTAYPIDPSTLPKSLHWDGRPRSAYTYPFPVPPGAPGDLALSYDSQNLARLSCQPDGTWVAYTLTTHPHALHSGSYTSVEDLIQEVVTRHLTNVAERYAAAEARAQAQNAAYAASQGSAPLTYNAAAFHISNALDGVAERGFAVLDDYPSLPTDVVTALDRRLHLPPDATFQDVLSAVASAARHVAADTTLLEHALPARHDKEPQ